MFSEEYLKSFEGSNDNSEEESTSDLPDLFNIPEMHSHKAAMDADFKTIL